LVHHIESALPLLDIHVCRPVEEPSQELRTQQEILVTPGGDPLAKSVPFVLYRGCHPPAAVGAERQDNASAVGWIGDCLYRSRTSCSKSFKRMFGYSP
jgi:hypothetical protein